MRTALELGWFWLVAAGLFLSGAWPDVGPLVAFSLLLSVGLYSFFFVAGVAVYELPPLVGRGWRRVGRARARE